MPLAARHHADTALEKELQPIVIITAEPGVDALAVGRLVAQDCGMRVVGVEALHKVAANTGLPLDVVTELLISIVPADDRDGEVCSLRSRSESASQSKNHVIRETRRTIARLAGGRSAVIVCHGAGAALADAARAVRVFLHCNPHPQVLPERYDLVLAVYPSDIQAAAQEIQTFLRGSGADMTEARSPRRA